MPSSKLTPSFPLVVSPPAIATSEGQDRPNQIQGCCRGSVRAILRWVLEGSDLLPAQLMSVQYLVTFSGILYPEETGTGCITSQPQQPIPAQIGDQRTPQRGGAANSPWQLNNAHFHSQAARWAGEEAADERPPAITTPSGLNNKLALSPALCYVIRRCV